MAGKCRSQTLVSAEEALKMEIIVNQALIDILIAKQFISEEELLESIRKLKKEQDKMIGKSGKIVVLQERTGLSRMK